MKTIKKCTDISTSGIDLAKNSFHVHGVDQYGKVVLSKSFTKNK